MAKLKIVPISAGVGHVYLIITDAGFFLVDAGTKGYESKIIKAITSRGLRLENLKFIFLTHAHYDHVGGAHLLKKETGAKIIVHEQEADNLRKGYTKVPNGTDAFFKILSFLGKRMSKIYSHFKAVEPNIIFKDGYDLSAFEILGKIIHTPGHTSGSSTLIIDKNAFAGDSIFNMLNRIYPPFANNEETLLKSWNKLLDQNVDWYYPAHGKRLKKEEIRKEFKKQTDRKGYG